MSDHRSRRAANTPSPDSLSSYERFAEVYDKLGFHRFTPLAVRKCEDYLAESGLVVRRVLDLACGTGHFAIALAKRGVEVTGVDGARGMIERARRNSRRLRHAPRWRQGTFLDFEAPGRYDLVTCWFDSLNHLMTDAQLATCFRRVRRHLEPGGAFLFDVNTPAGFRENWGSTGFRSHPSYAWHQRGLVDPDGQVARMEIEAFLRRGKYYERIRMPFCQRALTADLLTSALRAARFGEVEIAPFSDGETLETTGRLFAAARP